MIYRGEKLGMVRDFWDTLYFIQSKRSSGVINHLMNLTGKHTVGNGFIVFLIYCVLKCSQFYNNKRLFSTRFHKFGKNIYDA